MAARETAIATDGFEYAVAGCPRALREDVRVVLKGISVEALQIVCSVQRAQLDLVNIGPDVDREKDFLLERFVAWAKAACELLAAQGHWADYADPCSGLLVRNRLSNVIWPEVESMSQLLGYRTLNAGPCHILLHPRWGSACYPATLFTTAPRETALAALQEACDVLRAPPASGVDVAAAAGSGGPVA